MSAAILNGFSDPVRQAQQAFRMILDAMANPGRVCGIDGVDDSPPPLSPAATACALSLFDFETMVWLSPAAWPARDYLVFHCHCPFSEDRGRAAFALIPTATDLPAIDSFHAGSHEHPETSTTLIVEVDSLSTGTRLRLTGPGVDGSRELSVQGLSDAAWRELQANHEGFPLGIDLILTCGQALTALPRSTRIEVI